MARRNVPGTVYLLHLDPPYKHARHYLGFAEAGHLDARLADHDAGRGARLLAVAREAGCTWRLVRTWDGTRALERAIKNTRSVPHYCTECQPERNAARRAAREREKEMTANLDEEQWASARAGSDDAGRLVGKFLDAGMTPDRIAESQHEVAARLLNEAETAPGRAYAAAYDDTVRALTADLTDDAARAKAGPEAAGLPLGTPHPDPFLAGRGWHVGDGVAGNRVYVKDRAADHRELDREAG